MKTLTRALLATFLFASFTQNSIASTDQFAGRNPADDSFTGWSLFGNRQETELDGQIEQHFTYLEDYRKTKLNQGGTKMPFLVYLNKFFQDYKKRYHYNEDLKLKAIIERAQKPNEESYNIYENELKSQSEKLGTAEGVNSEIDRLMLLKKNFQSNELRKALFELKIITLYHQLVLLKMNRPYPLSLKSMLF